MLKPNMIENEQSLQCANKHNLPIVQVVLNPLLEKEQRLLCNQCLDNADIEGEKSNKSQKIDQVENLIIINIQQIELIQNQLDQLRSNILQKQDQLKFIVHDWINNLQTIGLRYQTYSFHEELENIINNRNDMKLNKDLLMKDIQEEYNNWNSKLTLKFELFNQFPEYNNCKTILLNHQLMISKSDLIQKKKDEQQILLSEEDDIILKKIDFSVKQQLIKSLNQHNDWVNALVYSKKQNSFISCSDDKTIRIWKDQGENDWISSFAYKQHKDRVYCMTINQNEDQLFSGSFDKKIIIWKLDFDKNELINQYSLKNYPHRIQSLSLNQSESQLVSCDDVQLIIWQRGLDNKMQFKQFVKPSKEISGQQVKFIKENQFVWVPNDEQVNEIFIFELQEGVYLENQEKKLQMNENKEQQNMNLFPIYYNKQRNLMIIRHKACIYFIREQNNGKFKIVEQLNLDTNTINGAATNNGLHFFFWDDQKREYSIYELQYK